MLAKIGSRPSLQLDRLQLLPPQVLEDLPNVSDHGPARVEEPVVDLPEKIEGRRQRTGRLIFVFPQLRRRLPRAPQATPAAREVMVGRHRYEVTRVLLPDALLIIDNHGGALVTAADDIEPLLPLLGVVGPRDDVVGGEVDAIGVQELHHPVPIASTPHCADAEVKHVAHLSQKFIYKRPQLRDHVSLAIRRAEKKWPVAAAAAFPTNGAAFLEEVDF